MHIIKGDITASWPVLAVNCQGPVQYSAKESPSGIAPKVTVNSLSAASSKSPDMWLADGDSLKCYIVWMSMLIASMF